MAVSYKKLWKILIDRDMIKKYAACSRFNYKFTRKTWEKCRCLNGGVGENLQGT